MKVQCPGCKQQYELEKGQEEFQLECTNCKTPFKASGNIVFEGPERVRQKSAGCSPILLFGAFFFLAVILLFCFYGCGAKKAKTEPEKTKISYKFGVSESSLRNDAWTMTQNMAKKRLRFPEEASFPWSPETVFEFEFEGKYGINLIGYVTAKNAFGVRDRMKLSATWHYDPQTKRWECKNFSMN